MLHVTPVQRTDVSVLYCTEQALAGGVMRKRPQDDVPSHKRPLLSLPDETISEIFIRFLPLYPEPPPLAGRYSPIVLTHICHRLREIARATPELWRAINLVFLLHQRAGKDAALGGPIWLDSSGCLPISLKYDCHYEAMQDSLDGGLLATLVQYRSRWEHLVLYQGDLRQLDAISAPLPLIRTLTLVCARRVPGSTVPTTTVALHSCNLPQLHSVHLVFIEPMSITLPWHQLTSLELGGISFDDALVAFEQAEALITLKLDIYHSPFQSGGATLVFSFLKTLQIVPYWAQHGLFHLMTISAPALRTLHISEHILGGGTSERICSLQEFITISGCSLHELRIVDANMSETTYRTAFPGIQFIEVL
ncbi:hypothetical protein R3P38DRAFT_3072199 [Favolaschia claudopus]|uniref:F-box domain-containing protein n=1 Tax=Favolaschia claudopus TaxID=2862362 RepID=A0AAV9ZYL3_9AGAR